MSEREHYFSVVLRLEPKLRRMLNRTCELYCGRSAGRAARQAATLAADEAWSDVVLARAERVVQLWDPAKGAGLDGYFIRTMRLYTHKWLARSHSLAVRQINGSAQHDYCDEDDEDGGSSELPDTRTRVSAEDAAEVEGLLGLVSEFDRWIIKQHLMYGYTFQELSEPCGASKSAVKVWYHSAMNRLREAANVK